MIQIILNPDGDRDLDADIAEEVFGWKYYHVGPDYTGQSECDILTPNGELDVITLPSTGIIHRGYLCPRYTSDLSDLIRLAKAVGYDRKFSLTDFPLDLVEIARACLKYFRFHNKLKELISKQSKFMQVDVPTECLDDQELCK